MWVGDRSIEELCSQKEDVPAVQQGGSIAFGPLLQGPVPLDKKNIDNWIYIWKFLETAL